MQEKKLNMFAKQEEYMALRQYIKLVGSGSQGLTESVRQALEHELTPR